MVAERAHASFEHDSRFVMVGMREGISLLQEQSWHVTFSSEDLGNRQIRPHSKRNILRVRKFKIISHEL